MFVVVVVVLSLAFAPSWTGIKCISNPHCCLHALDIVEPSRLNWTRSKKPVDVEKKNRLSETG